ncbi:MAG: MaoC family dehydratase [Hyphomicrobiaceae bacterium]
MTKTSAGNYFEDFAIGQTITHATPRTISAGDVALYQGLYGSRFAVQSSAAFARAIGYPDAPVDDLLVFHVVFGKTVPDISINAVANLGYAECRFLAPVFIGDTLSARSTVIGLKENSNGRTGVVYARTEGFKADGTPVLTYVRWVMVNKRDPATPAPAAHLPELASTVAPSDIAISVPAGALGAYDRALSGSRHGFNDYELGEQIDHVDGATLEEAEHQIATRLYQNTAKIHFNQHAEGAGRFGRRLVYGGVVISIARALSFNGLGNAFSVAGINAGRHLSPAFAGDTLYAWSQVLDKAAVSGRSDLGVLRLRLVAAKNMPCGQFPTEPAPAGPGTAGVVLDLDLWCVIPVL